MEAAKINTTKKPQIIGREPVKGVRRIELLCALALTGLVVSLHVYGAIHGGGLWRDEVGTLNVATMPSLSQFWSSFYYITPPPLPYAIVRIWTGIHWLGGSDASFRILGAFEGLGILGVFWANGKLLGYRTPLVSLLLFGLNPNMIQWGDSPRGYGLGALLLLLVYGLVWKVVESPTPKRVLLAAFVAILSVHCLFQNAPLLFVICLAGSLVCLRMRLRKRMLVVLGIGAIAALSLTPYLPIIRAYQEVEFIDRTTIDFPWILIALALAFSAFDSIDFLFFPWFICSVTTAVAAGYLFTLKQADRGDERKANLAVFSLTVLVFGILAFLVFSKVAGLQVHPWHCVPIVALTVLSIELLIDLATTTIPERLARLVVALLLAGFTLPFTWRQTPVRQTNIDIIASMLQEQAAQADLIVVNPWFVGISFQHYYRGKISWTVVPPLLQFAIPRLDLLKEQMMKEDPLKPVFDSIERTLRAGNRVWLVGTFAARPDGGPTPLLPPAPNGPGGWYNADYLRNWNLRLGYFLESHVLDGEKVNLQITQPVSDYENPPVQVFKGWRP